MNRDELIQEIRKLKQLLVKAEYGRGLAQATLQKYWQAEP